MSEMIIELGNVTITVPDITKPDWYGDYRKGKLALYRAKQSGHDLPVALTILVMYMEEGMEDEVFYSMYAEELSHEVVVEDIQNNLFDLYLKAKQSQFGKFGSIKSEVSHTIH